LKKQFDGGELCKLVTKRKKLPFEALDVWKYNRMRQKDIFSEPLVHGMCTDLLQMAEFPRTRSHGETNEAQDVIPDPAEPRGMDGVLDLNLSPTEMRGLDGNINLSPA
jgi:hypothetical protein